MGQTAFCTSAKRLLAMGALSFVAPATLLCATSTSSDVLSSIPGTDGIVVGMSVTNANLPAGTKVVEILSDSQVRVSKNATGTGSVSTTFTGDQFKFLLIKATPAHSFGAALTNVGTPGVGTPGNANVGTDEVTGTGYVSGGFALTNITPQIGTTKAFWSFAANPTWVGASIATSGGVIWSNTARLGVAPGGQIGGFAVATYDFNGIQQVNNGTMTIVLPTNAEDSAILQIN